VHAGQVLESGLARFLERYLAALRLEQRVPGWSGPPDTCGNAFIQLLVSRIAVYPVKSFAPLYPERGEVVETGFRHDRCWMVIDEKGRFLTQREHPEMARIHAVPSSRGLTLTAAGHKPVEVPFRGGTAAEVTEMAEATVWDDPCEAVDQGDPAAELLHSFLGRPCRLVRMRPGFRRELGPSYGGPRRCLWVLQTPHRCF
jgi:uncharacterized protein